MGQGGTIVKVFTIYNTNGSLNTYLIGHENGGDAIIIDPGQIDLHLLDILEFNNYYVKSILLTHTHENHTKGVNTLLRIYDSELYSKATTVNNIVPKPVSAVSGTNISGFEVTVIETPGHSDDSVVFRIRNTLFTGDVLHSGRIGTTRNTASRKVLQENIISKIFTLDENLVIFPGHGPPSTLKIEKEFNPFLNSAS